MMECDMIERDMMEHDMMECDMIQRDMTERDMIERDMIERDELEQWFRKKEKNTETMILSNTFEIAMLKFETIDMINVHLEKTSEKIRI